MKIPFLSLLLVAAIISTKAEKSTKITLEKIWLDRTFAPQYVYGLKSMKDGTHYSVLETLEGKQHINKYSYEKGDLVETILKSDLKTNEGERLRIEAYTFSKDENLLLLRTESEKIYRHSMRSSYYIYNRSTKEYNQIGDSKFQLASFSPDGKYVSYVRDNNIFLFNIEKKNEIAVTTDGVKNSIINGAPDWVYEEEFALVKGYEWSHDSKCLAYYRFDETSVKEFSFPVYGSLYPENYVYKYPKAGEDNSKVSIKIYHLTDSKTVKAEINVEYEYIPRIYWIPTNENLCIQTMNRLQNEMFINFTNRKDGQTENVLTDFSKTYLELTDLLFLEEKEAFLFQSERLGQNQLFLFDFSENLNSGSDAALERSLPITEEREIITGIAGISERDNKVIVEYTVPENPIDNFYKVYPIDIRPDENGIVPEGDIREINLPDGRKNIAASRDLRYLVLTSSSANSVPMVSVLNSNDEEVRVILDNSSLKDTLSAYKLAKKEFLKITNEQGIELNAWMIKPSDFDPKKKYPVLMYVYGGPGSQTVTNSWGGSNDMWYQYLAQHGYIVASVDNRGTGARTTDFRTCTYGQLGKLESDDQIFAAKYFANMQFVDEKRIGIWGWSYGGYMSTLCLAKGADVFKTAIAVAPVTNWRYYDSIYTERYMSLPSDNAKGYDENSPINHVDKITGNYLLVHGSADDNVHFQNTTELIDALVREDVQFDLAVYPNKNHGIYGGNTRYHLYTKMSNFLFENL